MRDQLFRRPMFCTTCLPAPLLRRDPFGLGGLAGALLSLMAARPAVAANGSGAIDVHAHFYPLPFLRALAEEGGPESFQVDISDPTAPTVGRPTFHLPLDPTYWDLEARLKRMDEQRVRLHALSLTLPMVHWAEPEQGARLARIFNDALAEANTAFPERFVGCATLPLQAPALALEELRRVVEQPAFKGAYFPTNVNGGEISDPDYDPLYALCEAKGLPVLLHPVGVIGSDRLAPYYLRNLLGNPFDTTVAAANLVFGGVLDRFPKLEVVLPHAGGALPILFGRLRRGQVMREEARDQAAHPFPEYLRRFHYDTIGHDARVMRYVVDLVGADRVMLGSDYCFDMGYEQPRDIVEQLGLTKAEKEKVLITNAAKLLKL